MTSAFKIESLLAARLFLEPKRVGDRVYFLSDLSGRLSLYAMDAVGSVPEPLLPPDLSLQNPHLMDGSSYEVLQTLGFVLVMIDQDGDENYQPMRVPLTGGMPRPVLATADARRYAGRQLSLTSCDPASGLAVFTVDMRDDPVMRSLLVDLRTTSVTDLGGSHHGNECVAATSDYSRLLLRDGYSFGDGSLFLWDANVGERRLLWGTPMEERAEGGTYPAEGIGDACFLDDRTLLLVSAVHDDAYGLSRLDVDEPNALHPISIEGVEHTGAGELEALTALRDGRFRITFNIDGCSWAYVGRLDDHRERFIISETVCGSDRLRDGVLEAAHHDDESDSHALTFSSATSPSQIYLRASDGALTQLTRERVLGIDESLLSPGEDASFESHDGLRISARLYRPAPGLGFEGPRPVVFYIHGGPQGQERPDFTWFSMPLIQFLTLRGFSVFVPNTRGSTGYGLSFMKRVDHDWGGLDRLDHVHAFDLLRQDAQLDMENAGVVGRSYGGYMTLTLAGRHPELWKAAVDMFGPYDLVNFVHKLPETWKTYFYMVLGHPERDRAFLAERSPKTYLDALACPMLVVQGANDPRGVERESRDVVEELRAKGKRIDYLVFENEGHDVLKYENKVRCYNAIADFFAENLVR